MKTAKLGYMNKKSVEKKCLGNGLYQMALLVGLLSFLESSTCAPYACSVIFVDCSLGFSKMNYKAIIYTGYETITIIHLVDEACNLFVDTNQKWGLITATGMKTLYYGVVYDCLITVGELS
ncbi:hypothetical protein HK096_000101, partial [Nowakowskiella sp. JEL0078]